MENIIHLTVPLLQSSPKKEKKRDIYDLQKDYGVCNVQGCQNVPTYKADETAVHYWNSGEEALKLTKKKKRNLKFRKHFKFRL